MHHGWIAACGHDMAQIHVRDPPVYESVYVTVGGKSDGKGSGWEEAETQG